MINPHETGTATIYDALGQELEILVPTIDEIRAAGELVRKWPGLIGRLLIDLDDVGIIQVLNGYTDAGGELNAISEAIEDISEVEDWDDPLAVPASGADNIPAEGWSDTFKPDVVSRLLGYMPE